MEKDPAGSIGNRRRGCTLPSVDAAVSPVAESAASDEADLIRAAQGGDRPAFAVLIDRYWDRLYRWLYRLTRDGTNAEDIAQETFMKAFAALAGFRAGTNFRAWLFRIGHNNFVNQKRSTRRESVPLAPESAHTDRGPHGEAVSRESMVAIAAAIAALPPDFRGALTLRVEEGLSFRDIAEVLGITEETARWRVFKARQKLMATLAPELMPASPMESKP